MTVIEEVKQEVAKVEEKVAEVVAEVKKGDDRIKIEIEATEKLALTKVENEYLKAQVEIQQLSNRIQQVQEAANKARTSYNAKMEELAKKYAFDIKKFVYNSVEEVIGKLPEAVQQGK
jgi:hypothetical protein